MKKSLETDRPKTFHHTLGLGLREGDFSEKGWAAIRATTRMLVLVDRDDDAFQDALPQVDCILVALGGKVDGRTIHKAHRLRYIGVLGTGYDGIDTVAAAKRGVSICNVPEYATEAVAEFTLTVILEELRHGAASLERARSGDLSEARFDGDELLGKTVGIIGMGRIGRRVAEIAHRGFGANVVYWSRTRKQDVERAGGTFIDLEDLLARSEIITVHVPLNEGTYRLLDSRRLGRVRRGSILVCLSPMGIIEIAPLIRHLRSGHFRLILDHADELSPHASRRLRALSNCRVYPPIGYNTRQAKEARESTFVSNIRAFLEGQARNEVGIKSAGSETGVTPLLIPRDRVLARVRKEG